MLAVVGGEEVVVAVPIPQLQVDVQRRLQGLRHRDKLLPAVLQLGQVNGVVFKINVADLDVQDIETLVKESLALVPGADKSYDAKTNVGARIRTNQIMVTAQTHGWLMANTCQRNEDVVGYATLWGDSVGSFSPLGMLTVSEVIEIGDDLGLPYELTHKTPIDGLQPLTDEEKLGFTYKELSDLIRFGIKGEHYDLIMQKFNANRFKLELIRLPKFDPHLPDYFKDNFGI